MEVASSSSGLLVYVDVVLLDCRVASVCHFQLNCIKETFFQAVRMDEQAGCFPI